MLISPRLDTISVLPLDCCQKRTKAKKRGSDPFQIVILEYYYEPLSLRFARYSKT